MQPRPERCLCGCVPASMPVISIPTCAHCNFTRVHRGYIERFGGTSVIEGKEAHVGAATLHCRTRTWLQRAVGCTNAVMGWGLLSVCWVNLCPCSQWRCRHPRALPAVRRGGTSPPPPRVQRREPVRLDPRRRVHRSPARASWGLCRQRRAHRAGRWHAVRSSRNAARVHSGGFCAVRFVSAHVHLPLHGSHYRAV